MLDFSNTKIAFSAKSDADLKLASTLFSAINSRALVGFFKGATKVALGVNLPIGWAVKPTLYKQFVGGERLEDCIGTITELNRYGVKSILDYSAESGSTSSDIENAYNETIHSITFASNNRDAVAFTVFKPTAMTTEEILLKKSNNAPFTIEENALYSAFRDRVYNLCKAAYDNGVKILVDAEDYCFQAAIDEVTEDMMRLFNRDRAIVFNTLQMYRHDRYAYLERIYADAVANGYIAGIKFVRGAYMEKERERALAGKYPSPICDTKEKTNDNFDRGVRFVVEHIDKMELFCGTHNEDSNRKLAELIDAFGIKRNDKRIFFSQLYGMSDNISYNLASEGYNVAKYMPYAPVSKVLPYLLRRAQENTSMAGQSSRELGYINKEIERRRAEKEAKAAAAAAQAERKEENIEDASYAEVKDDTKQESKQ